MGKHTIKDWIIATRPWSFTASAMPVAVTTLYMWNVGAKFCWGIALLAILDIVLFHAAGNTNSDYNDYKKGIDAQDTFGAEMLSITSGKFTDVEIHKFSHLLLAIAVTLGLVILALTNWWVLLFGVIGAMLVLLYPPMKFNAMGDLNILLSYAVVPTLGTSVALTGTIQWEVLCIAVPLGLLTDSILHANNTRDIETDTRVGAQTFASVIGRKLSAKIYHFEVWFPYLWILFLVCIGGYHWQMLVTFLAMPLSIGASKCMARIGKEGPQAIALLDQQSAKIQLTFGVLMIVGFLFGKLFA